MRSADNVSEEAVGHRGRRDQGRGWRVRYRSPDHRELSRSFRLKSDAERFAVAIESSKLRRGVGRSPPRQDFLSGVVAAVVVHDHRSQAEDAAGIREPFASALAAGLWRSPPCAHPAGRRARVGGGVERPGAELIPGATGPPAALHDSQGCRGVGIPWPARPVSGSGFLERHSEST